jgi:putative alpha-1,2-mannosidase
MTLNLENGKQFIIEAPQNSATNKYIQSVTKDNAVYTNNWLSHVDILKGGTLKIAMSNVPGKTWGVSANAVPYSFSTGH